MIEMFKMGTNQKLTATEIIEKDIWINLTEPTESELLSVSNSCQLPLDFLNSPLDLEESSRIDVDKRSNTTLITYDFPISLTENNRKATYVTIPLGIILTDQYLITICSKKTKLKNQILAANIDPALRSRFTLTILLAVADTFNDKLNKLNKTRIEIENRLQQSLQNKYIHQLLAIEKSMIYFLTSLKANNLVLEKIMRINSIPVYDSDKNLLETVIIETKQGMETSQLYKEILDSISDSYSSLISNEMNSVMKVLTVVTIILTVPTLVFSFYGMNVDLPLDQVPNAWILTLIISLIISLWLSFTLWRRRLF